MPDLSKLSDDELTKLYQSRQPASDTPDLSKLTDDQLTRLYQSRQPAPRSYAASEVPGQFVRNFLPSAVHGIAGMAEGVGKFAEAMQPNMQYGLAAAPVTIAKALYNDPSLAYRMPESIIRDYAKAYGGWENIKRTLAEDPFRATMDVLPIGTELTSLGRRGIAAVGDIGRAADVSQPFEWTSPPPLPATPAAAPSLREGLPRALNIESPAIQSGLSWLSAIPYVGGPLAKAIEAVPAKIGGKVEDIAQTYSPARPESSIGGTIEQTLREAGAQEAAAGETVAQRATEAARAQFEQDQAARRQAINAQHEATTAAADQAFGDTAPLDMSQNAINNVQGAHNALLERERGQYRAVDNLNARTNVEGYHELGDRARQALIDSGFSVDEPGSNAARMLDELDRLSGRPGTPAQPPPIPEGVNPRILKGIQDAYPDGNVPPEVWRQFGVEPPVGTPEVPAVPPDFRLAGGAAPAPGATAIPVQTTNEIVKRIGKMGMRAKDAQDQAASAIIKNEVGRWRADMFENHLTPDSEPGALAAIQEANATHRDRMQRFGHNYGRAVQGEPRNAQRALNQIVTGGMGREGLRDALIGANPGNKPISAPLAEAISNAHPNAPEFRNQLRGAYWNTINEGTPAAVARKVNGLEGTRMAGGLLNPGDQGLLQNYAESAARTPEALRVVDRTPPPVPTRAVPGEAEQLANRLGTKQDAAVLEKFDSGLKEGGNIRESSLMWRQMGEANRNDARGSWIRNMGAGKDNQFNLSQFVKNWNSYSDAAKTMMLTPEHRAALQEVYDFAKKYGENVQKYHNTSKTGLFNFWTKLIGGGGTAIGLLATGTVPIAALGSVTGGLGLYKLSKLLATPTGAQQVARWSRIARAYNSAPSARTLNQLQLQSRALQAMANPPPVAASAPTDNRQRTAPSSIAGSAWNLLNRINTERGMEPGVSARGLQSIGIRG